MEEAEEQVLIVSDTQETRNMNEEFSIDSSEREGDIDDIIHKLNRATTGSKGDLIQSILSQEEIKIEIRKKLPVKVPCPVCKKQTTTRVKPEASSKSWCYFWLMCIFLLWCCAPCVLYSEKYQDYHHYCSDCNRRIATYKPYAEKKDNNANRTEKVKVDIKRKASTKSKKVSRKAVALE